MIVITHCVYYVFLREADALKRAVTPENKTENYKPSQDFWTLREGGVFWKQNNVT